MKYDYTYFEEILYENGNYYKIIEDAPVYIKIKVEKQNADYAIIVPAMGHNTFKHYSQLNEPKEITNKRLFGFEEPQLERGGDIGCICNWIYGKYKELPYAIALGLTRFYDSCKYDSFHSNDYPNEWLLQKEKADKYWDEYVNLTKKLNTELTKENLSLTKEN